MNNLICIKTNCYKGFGLDEMLEGIKKAGFKYLELSATPGNSSGISRFEPFNKLCEIREKIKNKGLIPLSLGGHVNIMDENNLEDFVNNIRLAKFFGCKYIVTSVGDAHKHEEEIVQNEVVAENLKTFIPYLEEYDINLVIELHGKHCNGTILSDICKLTNSKRVSINYDTGNAIFYGLFNNDELIKDIEDHIDFISYMHVKDKLGEKQEWNFPALGKGYVPLKEIFDVLDKHHNESVLSVEIEFTPSGVKDIDEVNQALIDSIDYLKSLNMTI